ncbi:MAG: hypothetical protein E6J87_18540 [Deltaproteobacteria bacterium]|nr:MAG: hypothetical protein E6J87_18540 [Deltaproteobacteria bacterium]
MFASACQVSVAGSNALVRVSNGLPPDATMRPSSSVETPAQNMSWKLLSTVWNAPVAGSYSAARLSSRSLLRKSFASFDDQVSTRPSASSAALIAMCGQGITGPHEPSLRGSGEGAGSSCPSGGIRRSAPP